MSLCFQTFNHPSNVKICLSKLTSHRQGKKNLSMHKLPSPIIQKFASNDDPNRRVEFSPSTQSNGIGIIGGSSVGSSLNFAKKLLNFNSESEDPENSPPPCLVLCSDPTLSKDLLSAEKKSCFSAKTENIVEKIRCKQMFLENSGVCCCLVMPCDLLHFWYDEIEKGSCVPILHVGKCVAKELKETKLRPIEAGSRIRIGVLDTNQNLVARFYQEKLENEGFEVILPDKATIEHTVIPAIEALKRKDLEGAQNLFRIALQVLLVRAVNRVVLASDNIRQVLPPEDPLWAKCIDPMDALARSSIAYAQSVGRVYIGNCSGSSHL